MAIIINTNIIVINLYIIINKTIISLLRIIIDVVHLYSIPHHHKSMIMPEQIQLSNVL